MTKEKRINLAIGIIIMALGVLIASTIALPEIFDILLGCASLVAGLVLIIKTLAVKKVLFDLPAALGAVLIGLSVCFFMSILSGIVALLALILFIGIASIGGLLILDGIIRLIFNRNVKVNVIELVVGAILLTVGVLFLTIPELGEYTWVIFGVLVAILGLLVAINTFVDLKSLVKKS